MARSSAEAECVAKISAFGQSAKLTIAKLGNDERTATWFARKVAQIITGHELTAKQVNSVITSSYGHYVVASSLRPVWDAKPFYAEIRKSLNDQ